MRRPQCPRHPHGRVWLDGTYGKEGRRRQRYKCVPPNGEREHVFTEVLPRQRTASGHCDECEWPWGADEGAPSARRFTFTASEIAWALTRVGEGMSYSLAGRRIRERAGRVRAPWGTRGAFAPLESSSVEDWVEAFAPVLLEPRMPREWSSVVMLDDIPFSVNTPIFQGGRGIAFRVYGALAYERRNSSLLRLVAYPDGRPASWLDFLGQLEGRPDVIVCDAHSGMLNAIQRAWGDRPYHSPVVWLCHWHLQSALLKLVRRARLQHTNLGLALEYAFRNERTWRRFVGYAYASGFAPLRLWLEQPDATWWAHNRNRAQRVLWQLQQLDAGVPHTIRALETPFVEIRRRLKRRKFALRNRKRTNLMLGLMTLNQNGWDDERAYARELRLHLTDREGIAPPRHLITDPAGLPSLWP